MDSSNTNNQQQQRYCPTPIMAPPSVAASPPVMGSGVMGNMHQPQHHPPPPSISPHPGSYYGHHSGSSGHYPTPTPTPPPPAMHHQQYYQHPYYAHGSHQQGQPQGQQSHHMNTPAAQPPPQSQHSYPAYHHPSQPQQHHQQHWAPSHAHQQSHPYYNQPHHTQTQQQQHGYHPPPSPYTYQHSAAPTPPPQQPQQHVPPVPASPGPSQMHQPQQPQQNQALMHLSRIVSQQSPTTASPRASPSLAHHHQISQMGPQSPAPYSGHHDHHVTMNGHSSMGHTTPPVMSPPPSSIQHVQQAMSPPPPLPVPHHLPPQSQIPYNVNGSGGLIDRHNPVPGKPSPDKKHELEYRSGEPNFKEMHSVFPNLSSGLMKDSEVNNLVSSEPLSSPNKTGVRNTDNFYANSSPLRRESSDSGNADIPRPNGSGIEIPMRGNFIEDESSRSSISPQAKPLGSPTAGNGHQMMPVRLQNMQKGARTKASMKKLMQEQQIAAPNGQASDAGSEGVGSSGTLDEPEPPPKGKGKKSPKKKRSQSSVDSVPAPSLDVIPVGSETGVRPGYTKSGKKIGRPRKDSLDPPVTSKGKKKSEGNTSLKKGKKSVTLVEPEPVEAYEGVVAAPEIFPDQFVITQEDGKGKRKGGKGSRKKVLSDSVGDFYETEATKDLSLVSSELSLEETVTSEHSEPPAKKGKKTRKAATKAASVTASIESTSPDVATFPPNAISAILTSTAEQTAKNVKTITPKPKRGKKSEQELSPDVSVAPYVSKQKKSNKATVSPVIDSESSPETGGLPRLRSRSPKQSESPPLRVSSPRAAKERSATPAANTSGNQRSPRTSRSREKDEAEVTQSSPTLRSPKKPEAKGRLAKGKHKSSPNIIFPEDLSPPPMKRTRQVSKESRESITPDPRASVDSDRSLAGTRSSRRISGSAAGSTDNLTASDPSLNSLNPLGEGSFDVVPFNENITISAVSPVKRGKGKKGKAPSLIVGKRGKGKAAKSKSKISFADPEVISAPASEESFIPAFPVLASDTNATVGSSELIETVSVSPVKTKGKKKYVKKGKGKKGAQKQSSELALTSSDIHMPDFDSLVVEAGSEVLSDPALVSPSPKKGKKKATKQPRKKKSSLGSTPPSSISIPGSSPIQLNPFVDPMPDSDSLLVEGGSQVISDTSLLSPPKKGKKKYVKQPRKKKSNILEPPRPTINIPPPSPPSELETFADSNLNPVPPKKKGKGKAESKKSKRVYKKKGESSAELVETPEKDPYAFDSSDQLTGTSGSFVTDEEKVDAEGNFVFTPPPQGLPRRRRSSAMSPVNNQSAKGSPVAGDTPKKPGRRDSRSLSREMNEVSIVLSDIARSPEFAAMSFSPPAPPSQLSVLPPSSPPTISIPEQSPLVTPEVSADKLGKKRKREPKAKEEKPVKLSKSKKSRNEFQERKANLEAEVAQALLNLSSPSGSSKSPSPAKSIPGPELNETPKKKGKGGKSPKRKKSTSSRVSIDSLAFIQENIIPEVGEGDGFATPGVSPSPTKKGKGIKGRRPSLKKSKQVLPSPVPFSTPDMSLVMEGAAGAQSFPLPVEIPQPSKIVAKTAAIPTVSSLESMEFTPSPIVSPSKKKVKGEKAEGSPKGKKATKRKSEASPDIASRAATTSPLPKPKGKKGGKGEVKVIPNINQIPPTVEVVKAEESLGLLDVVEEPAAKKKRQRKPKASTSALVDSEMPSTSAAVSNTYSLASPSKLFPFKAEPEPYKKPTVFTKINQFGKADDNQKNKEKEKEKDGPSVRVLGGIARFYRGGEEEEVDQDPRLPKEKGQLPTDNAVPWKCCFCHLGPHAQKLGDLFGPYFADLPPIYGNAPKRETWFHGDCALWAGRLIMVGTYIRRLEETLQNADQETCTVCNQTGATIGCLRRGCKEAVHYPCAIRKFWKIDAQQFHSYCPKHASS